MEYEVKYLAKKCALRNKRWSSEFITVLTDSFYTWFVIIEAVQNFISDTIAGGNSCSIKRFKNSDKKSKYVRVYVYGSKSDSSLDEM